MEHTIIIGENKEFAERLKVNFIEFPSLNEIEIHDWILQVFKDNEIEKLILEIDENPIQKIKIALHIRLSLDQLKKCVFIPIVFLSNSPISKFIANKSLIYLNQVFSTDGIAFCDYGNLKNIIQNVSNIDSNKYKTNFLDVIKISPDEIIGRHSIANIWGAYSLEKSAGIDALKANDRFVKERKKLYFKYLYANNSFVKIARNTGKFSDKKEQNLINAKGKRILLIDDEADKGWEDVLRKIFKTSLYDDFVVIKEKVQNYVDFTPESKKIIEEQSFDLFLVDLRLNGMDEDENQRTDEFSGMNVLKKIKTLNKGNQVIIFTASNKAWNLKKLIDEGADGYYIKESPEYNFSDNLSEDNYIEFKSEIEKCFKKDFFRELYKILTPLQKKVELNKDKKPKNYKLKILQGKLKEYYNYIESSDFLLYSNPNELKYCFLQLILIIEDIIKSNYIQNIDGTHYVEKTLYDRHVCLEYQGDGIKLKLKPIKRWNEFIEEDDILRNDDFDFDKFNKGAEKIPFNYRLNSVLYFKYNIDLEMASEYSNLYTLRSTSVAHIGKSKINVTNILKSLELLNILID